MEDRLWVVLATLGTLLSSAWGAYALGARARVSNQWNDGILLASFMAQSVFMEERSQKIGHCPLTNLFETVVFLAWSLLLAYLIIGSVYRMSILGAFTAPLVFVMNFFALILPIDQPAGARLAPLGWVLELHATLSVLAYGMLGLTAVAGALYLVQERHLKHRDLSGWFQRLPSMGDLEAVLRRVLWCGFILLTVGIFLGLQIPHTGGLDWVKFLWSVGVWLIYLVLILAPHWLHISQKRVAWLSIVGYAFVLLTFWGINSLSKIHRFDL